MMNQNEFLKEYGLQGKVAIVTGGGAGIGKGIVLELARAGADVVIADIDPITAKSTLQEVLTTGNRGITVIGDVQESQKVEELVQAALNEFGHIDILVNNVGGLPGIKDRIPVHEMSEEMWDRILRLNTKPLFLCTKAIANAMIASGKGGSIVNLSSLVGLTPPSSLCIPYGLAKAGIINFTVTAAADLAKYEIRVNAVAPGRFETPMTAGLRLRYPEMRLAQTRLIPLGRLGKPEDIGKVAVFLCSNAAAYISGHTVVVSGGLTHLYTPTFEEARAMQGLAL